MTTPSARATRSTPAPESLVFLPPLYACMPVHLYAFSP